MVTDILECMIAAGHNLASLRKSELDHLAALLARLNRPASNEPSSRGMDVGAPNIDRSVATPAGPSALDDVDAIWSSMHNDNLAELAEMLSFDSMRAQKAFPLDV